MQGKKKKNHQIKHSKFKRCDFSNGKPVVREIISFVHDICKINLDYPNLEYLESEMVIGRKE